MEEEELEEFELLEQAAANASFSSNSSVVVKVLAKARGNVQDSKKVISGQSADSRGRHLSFDILSCSHLLTVDNISFASSLKDGVFVFNMNLHHRCITFSSLRDGQVLTLYNVPQLVPSWECRLAFTFTKVLA